jgi:hypothetical protein
MMKSEKSLRFLDLDRDLPTSAKDIHALRRARKDKFIDLQSYLDFLSRFSESSLTDLSEKKGPAGSKPFKL